MEQGTSLQDPEAARLEGEAEETEFNTRIIIADKIRDCRALEDERRRVAGLHDEASTATAARDTWKAAHGSLEAQLRDALQDADGRGKEVARLRAAAAQLEREVEQLRAEGASREAAFEDSLKQLDAAAAQLREAEAAGRDALDKLRHAEARAAAAEDSAERLQAANEDLSRRCVPSSTMIMLV